MSSMSVILLITLKHSFGKQRKQKDFLFALFYLLTVKGLIVREDYLE